MYLSNFIVLRPSFVFRQSEALQWLEKLHIELSDDADSLRRLIKIVCCKEERIFTRHFVSDEFCKRRGLAADIGERSAFYAESVQAAFDYFYKEEKDPPKDLIHVTCTGYNAPSAAQKLVARKDWTQTLVTHAYHMGCMAALPAVRIAKGYAASGSSQADIVHTELCSIHFNPAMHSADQLVAQSLFADGFIKYSCFKEPRKGCCFEILLVHEEMIPATEDKMRWECEHWGMKMALSKDIPKLIRAHISKFIQKLEIQAGTSLKNAYFAIHPGGPKIIDFIKEELSLNDRQTAASENVFRDRGNMSSATVPHIWKELLLDRSCPEGSHIVSLAFGPGLCVCGSIFKKREF